MRDHNNTVILSEAKDVNPSALEVYPRGEILRALNNDTEPGSKLA